MLLTGKIVLASAQRGTVRSVRGICTTSGQCDKAARFVRPLAKDILPRGYAVSATYAGIKAAISPKLTAPGASSSASSSPAPKPDLALIVSAYPASVAGVFTQNVFQAAPVQVGSATVASGKPARAVLVNSGCANAVTGARGVEDVQKLTAEVARQLSPAAGLGKEAQVQGETLMMSTGVIGVPLPLGTITRALPHLASGMVLRNDPEAWAETSRAFMTTDTFPKLRARRFELGGRECRLVGISKGAGMIHPRMGPPSPGAAKQLHATLLSIVATDAPIEKAALQQALNHAVSRSFNSISVDGDMSTNDTVLALANGAVDREAPQLTADAPEFSKFQAELTALCLELAHLLVRDGEGATKFVRITVAGAPTRAQAHAIASSISTSALVKTALHGADANWGRILCAAGYAPLPPFTAEGAAPSPGQEAWSINPAKVSVTFLPPPGVDAPPLPVLSNGVPQAVNEDQAAALLAHEDIVIRLDLQEGPAEADFWTCDLSKEYVSINGDYRS